MSVRQTAGYSQLHGLLLLQRSYLRNSNDTLVILSHEAVIALANICTTPGSLTVTFNNNVLLKVKG